MTAFDRLKQVCEKRGISINMLEEKIGLGKNTLYSWNKKTPSGTNLMKVADYLNVSTDYLLGRTSNKNIEQHNDIELTLSELIENISNDNELIFKGRVLNENSRTVLKTSFENIYNIADILSTQKNNEK